MSVTVYSKPNCVQCNATYKALEQHGVPYEVIDLSLDLVSYDAVIGMGYRQVPVVVAGTDHWSGFRPDKISALVSNIVAA